MGAEHEKDLPDWYRGTVPADLPWHADSYLFTGEVSAVDLRSVPVDPRLGIRSVLFHLAHVQAVSLDVTDLRLTSAWSRFDGCTFTRSGSPGASDPNAGTSWGLHPSLYTDCSFTGADLSRVAPWAATFEGCTFVDCDFRRLVSFNASFVSCRFAGPISGALFATASPDPGPRDPPVPARLSGNDFTAARIDEVRWVDVDLDAQRWPTGYTPVLSPWTERERRRDALQEDWEQAVAALRDEGWTARVLVPAPVQIWGTLPTGQNYYFRARHTDVSLAVGGDDPADAAPWRREVTYGEGSAASYLTPDAGMRLLLELYESWIIQRDAT